MKENILDRYRRTATNRPVIDVAAGKVEDLYDEFDRQAPFIVKDLDAGLVEYITDSARDLDNEDFIIHFNLASPPDNEMMMRIRDSVKSYFFYLRDLQARELRRTIRTSVIFMVMGMGILFLSVWVNQGISDSTPVVGRVFAEGLTVAAWVALWEALANFLVNWRPYRRQMKVYEKVAGADLEFSGTPIR